MKIVDLQDKDDYWEYDVSCVQIRGKFRWITPYWKVHEFRTSNPKPDDTFGDVLRKKFNTSRSLAKDIAKGKYKVLSHDGTWRVVEDDCMLVWDNMQVQYTTHVHEPPVSAERIRVLFEDANYVVVNKPSSMPSQVGPPFFRNSLLGVLCSQNPRLRFLMLCHRLDLVTSGILIIGKNNDAVTSFREKMKVDLENGDGKEPFVRKHYVARVKCNFPDDQVVVTKRLWAKVDGKRSHGDVRVRHPPICVAFYHHTTWRCGRGGR